MRNACVHVCKRCVVVLDGLATSVAALIAVRLEPAAAACLVAGQRGRERGHQPVLAHLGCEPLLDRAATARVSY
jgi:nicotinate-nucleotide--dimethylbenzimidazole phosphoribosyltransferase